MIGNLSSTIDAFPPPGVKLQLRLYASRRNIQGLVRVLLDAACAHFYHHDRRREQCEYGRRSARDHGKLPSDGGVEHCGCERASVEALGELPLGHPVRATRARCRPAPSPDTSFRHRHLSYPPWWATRHFAGFPRTGVLTARSQSERVPRDSTRLLAADQPCETWR